LYRIINRGEAVEVVKGVRIAWLLAFIAVVAVALATVVVVYDIMLAGEEQHYLPMKDALVTFIASNHPDAASFITNLDLIYQGRGIFSGEGWILDLSGSNTNGTIYADFSIARTQNSSGIPHRILWSGVVSNGTIIETNYTHAL
jgi:hypothetical protein